jgi:hypothetical protein
MDIDCTADSTSKKLAAAIEAVALELQLEVAIVPIEAFIPLPRAAQTRHHFVGQFGEVQVFVFDPYSIALSKLARGIEADIQDILFLLHGHFIELDELIQVVEAAVPQAWSFDIDPKEMVNYLEMVKKLSLQDPS